MALAPVAYFSDPLEDYLNQFIKFFEQGTTTPLSMATDSGGLTTLAKAEISGGGTVPIGFIKTAGDAIFIPWVDGDYDLWIFPTASEADANDTSNAIQIANDINSDRSSDVLIQTDKRYSAVFGSVSSMVALTMVDGGTYTPLSGQSVYLTSYYASIPFTEPQGGGGDFRVMTLAEYALTPDEAGAAFTIGGFAFVRDLSGEIGVREFGAVEGESATTAVQAALDATPVTIREGTFEVNGLTSSKYLTMMPGAKFLYNGAAGGRCITLSHSFGDVFVDMGGADASGIQILGNQLNGDLAFVENIALPAGIQGQFRFGIDLAGDDVYVKTCRTLNFTNLKGAGHNNDSFPQAIVTVNDVVRIDNVMCEDCVSGFVVQADRVSAGTVSMRNMQDNGVYMLGGDLTIDDVIYQGTEEAVVVAGGDLTIQRITVVGFCFAALSLQTAQRVEVNEIVIRARAGESADKVIVTRSGSTTINSVHIGSISGTMQQSAGIFGMIAGTIERFSLDHMNLTLDYDAAIWNGLNNWWDFTACEEYHIQNCEFFIIDINDALTGPDVLAVKQGTPIRLSHLENVDAFVRTSTGADSPVQVRMGTPKEFLQLLGFPFQVNVGPHARERTYHNFLRDSVDSIPTIGFWTQGRILNDVDAGAASFAVKCTVGGDPATFVTLNGTNT